MATLDQEFEEPMISIPALTALFIFYHIISLDGGKGRDGKDTP